MNKNEQRMYAALRSSGYVVLRNGWPDFMVMNDKMTCGFGLELKTKSDCVSPEQEQMHLALRAFGIPVHVAREDFNVHEITSARHFLLGAARRKFSDRLTELQREVAQMESAFTASTVLFDDMAEKKWQEQIYAAVNALPKLKAI